MGWRGRTGTILFVTVVSVLIWYWAAAETLETDRFSFTIHPTAAEPGRWLFTPSHDDVVVTLEGSAFALDEARSLNTQLMLTLGRELPSRPDEYTLRVVDLLKEHEALQKTGVNVVSSDPSMIQLRIDPLVEVTAPVRPVLPSFLQVEGEVVVKPPQVRVRLPEKDRLPDLVVEAEVDPSQLEGVQPGQPATLRVPLALPELVADGTTVTIMPATATVEFTVRSRIREAVLPIVTVQIAGPAQDYDEFVVEIDEKDRVFHDVRVRADGALVQQIEQDRDKVVALVHLSLNEKEQGIESKPVTCFMALLPDGGAELVEAQVGGSAQPPVIHFKIRQRG